MINACLSTVYGGNNIIKIWPEAIINNIYLENFAKDKNQISV
jgi:hypothetical protein